jgi:hypothetical protein
MLVICCIDSAQLQRLRSALPATETVLPTRDWQAFTHAAPGAECCILGARWLDQDGIFQRLCLLQHRSRLAPLVLVTSKDADNMRALKDLNVEEVVWLHEVERHLLAAVKRASARGLIQRLARRLEGATHLAPALTKALVHAFRSERPVATVEELAAATRCDRRTLWYHWYRTFDSRPPVRLEDFLDWLVLIRASAEHALGRSWPVVAVELGVHEHTLARMATRLVGVSLRELGSVSQSELSERFTARVLHPLLGGSDLDVLR